jgi:putative protein kinase ArgK-like GTPase of G3E family
MRLLKTIASEGQGLDVLLARLTMLEEQYRNNSVLAERRRQSFTIETLDWALEMLRPRLEELLSAENNTAEPRLSAQQIIAKLGQEFSQ